MKRLVAGLILLLSLGTPAIAYADQGPGYGGNADGLEVSWDKKPQDKALAAAPPPVPSDSNSGDSGATRDPQRIAMDGDSASLRIDGVGFRGLSEVSIQFGSQDPVAVRADTTGTVAATFPGTDAAAPGTTVVAIGRGPSGATRTLVGSVPPLPNGVNLMGLVPWVVALPIILLAAVGMLRRRPQQPVAVDDSGLLLAPPPAGLMVAQHPMPAPTGAPVVLPVPGPGHTPMPAPTGPPVALTGPTARPARGGARPSHRQPAAAVLR